MNNFMKSVAKSVSFEDEITAENGFAIDTTFVLFFLAVELGQNLGSFALDSVMLAMSLLMLLVLPYFLTDEKPGFANWVLGRTLIAVFAIMIGVIFHQILGSVLPQTFSFLPMTLLIVTAMLTCYIQFYSFLKVRLAK